MARQPRDHRIQPRLPAPSPRPAPPARRRGRAAAAPAPARRAPPAARAPAPRPARTPRSPARAAPARPPCASSRARVGRRQIDHRRQQQRLRAHAAVQHLLAQRLVRQPLMRGVLVDQHQRAVGGDRDDVGVQHLRHRRAERMVGARLGGRQQRARPAARAERQAAPRPCPGSGQRDGMAAPRGRPRLHQMQRRPRRGHRDVPAAARQRPAERADHQRAHRAGVAEAQLGLGRDARSRPAPRPAASSYSATTGWRPAAITSR